MLAGHTEDVWRLVVCQFAGEFDDLTGADSGWVFISGLLFEEQALECN